MLFEKLIQGRITKLNRSEKLSRSLVKTLSWRVVGTLDTILITYLITHRFDAAAAIGGLELISKMVLYFLHERAWNNIKWGNERIRKN